MRIKIAEGSNYGTSLVYRFKKQTGTESGEIYFRYHLRPGNDWDPKTGGNTNAEKLAGRSGKEI